MALPLWATNLTDIYVGGAGTFTKLGSGAAGLNTESDYFIQGTDCQSKNAWTNAIKGMMHDNGTGFTVPTTGAIIQWLYYAAVNALEVQEPGGSPSNGGLMFAEGSAITAYNRYNVAGSDTLTFDSWVPYVVDPNTATPSDTVGSPSGTEQWVGAEANLPTTAGPTKGAPIAVDAIRYGRCDIEYTEGQGGDFNTFVGAEAYGNDVTRRWGVIEFRQGSYFIQGFHSLGVSGTLVDFRDSNKVIFIRDTLFVAAGFNRIEVIHASSNVDWDNILFQALGTQSPGTFVHTAGTLNANLCQFVDVGTFSLLAASVFNDCTFRNTGIITAPGSDLQRSSISGYEGTFNTSPLIWDVATDPSGLLDDMVFTMGSSATHAIEFGITSPLTMTLNDCVFTGYDEVANNVNDSTLHIKRTSGTVTINIQGTGTAAADITYRTDGATVSIVGSVNLKITVKDQAGVAIQNAQTAIYDSSDTELMNEDTTAGGIAEESYTGSTPEAVTVRVRKGSTGATKYIPVSSPQTILSNGLDITITMTEDTTNST